MKLHPLEARGGLTAVTSDATPLMSLDAVVLDTETTELDAATARLIQIGAVRLRAGHVANDDQLDLLIDPGAPIPETSTAIHGISDAAVAGAPDFAGIVAPLDGFVGNSVVIGHNVGFDLTVLRNEYHRSGLPWRRPRTLDTLILARIARDSLAEFSLDAVASWLGITIWGRHTALGDATATAHVFVALVPLLRAQGIRTLAEAETASRAFSDVFEQTARVGWVAPVRTDDGERHEAFARIDSFPFRHRAGEVMAALPVVIGPDASIADAACLIAEKNVSSAFVRSGKRRPCYGIVTERDLMRALAESAASGEVPPVSQVMSSPLETVPASAFLYQAIGHMQARGFRHLGVVDEDGELVGALTTGDLLRQRAGDAILLGDEIEHADNVAALAAAWARLPTIARRLADEGVGPRHATAVIGEELCTLTRRAAQLGERRMAESGKGPPPVPYCVLVLGSGGRGESLLAPDQDNALIYADGVPGGPEDRWFEELGGHIADILNHVGVPYCNGGVMAKSAEWRCSVAGWRDTIDQWIRRSDWKDLCYVDIFYDFRAVYGDEALASEIWQHAYSQAHRSPGFLKLLAGVATDFRPPISLFGGIRTDAGRVDLKKQGLIALISGARVLALRHDVRQRSTKDRIEGARAHEVYNNADLSNILEAQEILLGEILAQQLDDIAAGIPPSNGVVVKRISKRRRQQLKWALRQIDAMNTLVDDPFAFG